MSLPLLAYFVASGNAHAMDRRGPPGRAIRLFVLIPAAIVVLGFAALLIEFVVSFAAWKVGIG